MKTPLPISPLATNSGATKENRSSKHENHKLRKCGERTAQKMINKLSTGKTEQDVLPRKKLALRLGTKPGATKENPSSKQESHRLRKCEELTEQKCNAAVWTGMERTLILGAGNLGMAECSPRSKVRLAMATVRAKRQCQCSWWSAEFCALREEKVLLDDAFTEGGDEYRAADGACGWVSCVIAAYYPCVCSSFYYSLPSEVFVSSFS